MSCSTCPNTAYRKREKKNTIDIKWQRLKAGQNERCSRATLDESSPSPNQITRIQAHISQIQKKSAIDMKWKLIKGDHKQHYINRVSSSPNNNQPHKPFPIHTTRIMVPTYTNIYT